MASINASPEQQTASYGGHPLGADTPLHCLSLRSKRVAQENHRSNLEGRLRLYQARELLPSRFPFFGREERWTDLDEAREHIEDGDSAPRLACAGTEAFFIQIADDVGKRKVLHEQFHHQDKSLMFARVDLKTRAVVGDAQAVGDFFVICAVGQWGVARQLAPPFDGDKLPACGCALCMRISGLNGPEITSRIRSKCAMTCLFRLLGYQHTPAMESCVVKKT